MLSYGTTALLDLHYPRVPPIPDCPPCIYLNIIPTQNFQTPENPRNGSYYYYYAPAALTAPRGSTTP